jgi:cytochrome c biogenesis protein CcmG, thiol:disulfide interchange protein DsbE
VYNISQKEGFMKKLLYITLLFTFVFSNENNEKATQKLFPNVKIKTLKNKTISTDDILDGKLTLVNFWATYCVPCRKEMKFMSQFFLDYKDSSFQVVGISIDDSRTAKRVKSVIKSKKLVYPIFLDTDNKLYGKFNTSAMPLSVLVDSSGYIVWEHTGYIPGDEKEMEMIIRKELNLPAIKEGENENK